MVKICDWCGNVMILSYHYEPGRSYQFYKCKKCHSESKPKRIIYPKEVETRKENNG